MAPVAVVGAIAVVGAAASIASNVMAANAKQTAANAQASGYEYDAKIKQKNAQQVEDQAAIDANRQELIARRQIGGMTAELSASGGTKGDAMDVLQDSVSVAQQDVQNIKRKGDIQAQAYTDEANMDLLKAGYTRAGGQVNTAQQILGGIGTGASAFPTVNKSFGG